MDHRTRLSILRRTPLLGGLSPQVLEALADIAVHVRHEPGDTVFLRGAKPDAVFAISTGTVRVLTEGTDGQETTFRSMGPGTIFGELAVLDGQPRSSTVRAVSDCVLLRLPRTDFLRLVRREPDLAFALLELVVQRVRVLSDHVEESASLPARARLVRHLLRLGRSRGVPTDEGLELDEHLPQSVLASTLALSRQTVNRLLQALQDEGLIRVRRARLVLLDPQRLAVSETSPGDTPG